MDETNFDSIIDYLLDNSISITLSKDSKGVRWYDLNTQMKSDLKITFFGNEMHFEGRYNSGTFDDLQELLYKVKDCMCGRDFASCFWIDLLVKQNVLVKTTVTTTTTTTTYS